MITRNGQVLELNERCFYVNAALEGTSLNAFCFKTLHQAIWHSQNGTKERPMTIYLEPDVYQMLGTMEDRGLYIHQDWVRLIGLTNQPEEVVIADNRGHMIGTKGKNGSSPAETLYITGTGFCAENLTIGNYCNVDLIYPNDRQKSQKRRSDTITQAYCIGAMNLDKTLDYFVFKNVRFISLLDTLALGAVKRAYFEKCYIQGTDDFMGGGEIHVMKDTTIHCFSGKPIYKAGAKGSAFLNCKWEIEFKEPTTLNLAKHASTLYLINCQFEDLNGHLKGIRWSTYPEGHIKSYSYGVTLNQKPYEIGPESSSIRLNAGQASRYISTNLLGEGWIGESGRQEEEVVGDEGPLNIQMTKALELIPEGEKEEGICQVEIYPKGERTGLTWESFPPGLLTIQDAIRGVRIKGNHQAVDTPTSIRLRVTASNGIYNECQVMLYPYLQKAPTWKKVPVIQQPRDGSLTLVYELEGEGRDTSEVTWYRYTNEDQTEGVKLASTNIQSPLVNYRLSAGDVGHYIGAVIQAKYSHSKQGESYQVIMERMITWEEVKGEGIEKYSYETDFSLLPTDRQEAILPGIWTVDSYYPLDQSLSWERELGRSWRYGEGIDGAYESKGFLTIGRGARLLWMQEGEFEQMKVILEVNIEKLGGQGFGSATDQYLEVYIKYDPHTLSGYGLRIERTTKYGCATDFTLLEYREGKGRVISETFSSSAFTSLCTIELKAIRRSLSATIDSSAQPTYEQQEKGLGHTLSLAAPIQGNNWGGMGIQHTGTVSPGNRIQLKRVKISYSKEV